jgi:glycosyltransferase involved in cell wall biosynthesis
MSSKKSLRIGVYDPYLNTLGGGERYVLTVVEYLLSQGYQVDLFWSGSADLINQATNRFNLNLTGLNIVPDIFKIAPSHLELVEDFPPPSVRPPASSFLSKLKTTLNYDLIFYLSDGSLPFLLSRRKLIHFQVPFSFNPNLKTRILNRLKLLGNTSLVINSQFTANFVHPKYPAPYKIIYPPVDIAKFKPDTKQNIILSVGRFDNILNAKRQDVLIDIFADLVRRYSLTG